MPDTPPETVTNPPFGITKERLESLSDKTETKIGKLAWKVACVVVPAATLALVGWAYSAAQSKVKEDLHAEIAKDVVVGNAMTAASDAKAAASNVAAKAVVIDQQLAQHTVDLASLHAADEKFSGVLEKVAGQLTGIQTTLATVAQKQDDNQRENRENTRRIDTTLNAISQKR